MTRVATVLVLASTFCWLAVLFAVQPFDRVNAALDHAFGAMPAWTQVEKMYSDPETQEVTRGEDPRASFRLLEQRWATHSSAERIVLMGNSQTQMTSLAKGEPPPEGLEKTYTDQIADYYRGAGSATFYRLSAGALSYEEMLWYAAYLVTRPEIKPNVLLVQLNYQNFVNGGIRGGMASLLSEPAFRGNVEDLIRRNRPESGELAETVRAYGEHQHREGTVVNQAGVGPKLPPGYAVETAFRKELDRIPDFQRRRDSKESFVLMLIRLRTYVLHMSSSSRRSLGGTRIAISRAALEDLAELCSRSGIRLILFQAPTNPAAAVYGTAEDENSYHEYTNLISSRFGVTLLDFEHSIPDRYWGMSLNVPDPLHLGREGHRLMAAQMIEGLRKNGL